MNRCVPMTVAAAFALAGCMREAPAPDSTAQAPAPAADTTTPARVQAFSDAITAEDVAELVKTLSSDAFEGRAPGTPGEDKTVDYIRAQFERIGLKPGNGADWFQTVPMQETTADENTTMTITVDGKPHSLEFGSDMVVGTRSGKQQVTLDASDLVFVGYGVDAPERQWNDYAGIDVKGKTVVVLVNDPGFHAKDASLFDGDRMTYYGRWTYKFEEAARKGAAGALIVHDTEGASYGWDVVQNSWSGAQYDLPAADDPEPRLPIQGWISAEQGKAIFSAAGLDLDKLRADANKRGFKAVPLPATVSLDLNSTVEKKSSRNVLGLLPGTERSEEAVVYLAHWDHIGKRDNDQTPDGKTDVIYNGAVDNATGVAGIIEIAEQMAKLGKPKRSVLFLAVTLEESGLLGSKYYVAKPTIPLHQIVGVINLDAMGVVGKTRDLVVTGLGNSELEDILKPIAAKQGRTLVEEGNPAGGYYFRSDHFNFVKAGVPALYPDAGSDLIEGGKAAGAAAAQDYVDNHYHKPSDEYDPNTWKLDGIVDDLTAAYDVGMTLANGNQWPNWYQGNAFKALRDKMMRDRKPTANVDQK